MHSDGAFEVQRSRAEDVLEEQNPAERVVHELESSSPIRGGSRHGEAAKNVDEGHLQGSDEGRDGNVQEVAPKDYVVGGEERDRYVGSGATKGPKPKD